MKNFIRYFLGQLVLLFGLREFFRFLYIAHGKHFISKRQKLISKSWARRSVVTNDFIPFVSDLDVTILIDDTKITEMFYGQMFKADLLIRDIQFVSPAFYSTWLRTGGLRNRQINHWLPLSGGEHLLRLPQEKQKSIIAFEIAHEVFLLYRQLQEHLPFGITSLSYKKQASQKLCLELKRLQIFWETSDESILWISRKDISLQLNTKSDLIQFLESQNHFWGELLENLTFPLGQFDMKPLVKETTDLGSELRLTMNLLPVFVTDNFQNLARLRQGQPKFVCTRNFLCLVKGVGVQEQTELNQLAKDKNGYYFGFNQQRLAHDLIHTLITAPDNASRLFFCFKNIKEFAEASANQIPREWPEVDRWDHQGPFPFQGQHLLDISLRHLELLRSLG